MRHGKKLGGKIKQVMSIVSYSTFRRWVRKMEGESPAPELKATKPGAGRPPVQADIQATVIRIRKETGRGYTWTTQQGRNFQMHLEDEKLPCEILMRDNGQKYPDSFDEVFRTAACQIKRNTPASPNLQAHVERVVQTLKNEVLNAFCIVSDVHLDYILKTAMDWYNKRRGHSARDDLPPVRDGTPPDSLDFAREKIVCDTELGGHLKSYRRAA